VLFFVVCLSHILFQQRLTVNPNLKAELFALSEWMIKSIINR
jgi:hypothetical protein